METVHVLLTLVIDSTTVDHPATWKWQRIITGDDRTNRDGVTVAKLAIVEDSSQSGVPGHITFSAELLDAGTRCECHSCQSERDHS